MAKITFYLDGNPVVFEGDAEEVAQFLKRVQRDNITLATGPEESKERMKALAKDREEVEWAKTHMPSVGDVIRFIRSQPQYRHSTFDVQKFFFKRTFKARGVSEGLFHDFLRLATDARARIEQTEGGVFASELVLGRHKVYHWVPKASKHGKPDVSSEVGFR